MRCAAAVLAIGVLLTAVPVRAASDTWGYNFGRTRVTTAPIAQDVLTVPNGVGGAPQPFVVPLPGRSQSTPVVHAGRWYLWTYWDGGRRGALWTGRLHPGTASSSPGRALRLPGAATAVLRAGAGQRFDEPADAAISPDGAWVAFGAGDRLYWWPTGDPAAGGSTAITGPGPVAAEATSPTFVADRATPSGWAVCDGDWDGGFGCFAVGPATGVAPEVLAGYQTRWGGLTAPITSSAALGGRHTLVFGVASARDPRLIAVDLAGGRWRRLAGPGAILAPVWAAVAVAGRSAYATDAAGNVYRVPLEGGSSQRINSVLGPLIEPPTVAGGRVFLTAPSHPDLYVWDPRDGRRAWVSLGGGGAPGTPTLVRSGAARTEVIFTRGGGGLAADALEPGGTAALGLLAVAPAATTRDPFTAAVVDGPLVLVWDDAAASAPGRRRARVPSGAPGGLSGGLEVFGFVPRLTAVVAPPAVRVGSGAAVLRVLAPVGARVTASASGRSLDSVPMAPTGAAACPASWRTAGTNVGAFADTGGGSPVGGCGPGANWAGQITAALAAATDRQHPDAGGVPPVAWAAAGARYLAWQMRVPGPEAPGPTPLSVVARMPDGRATVLHLWVEGACPAGEAAGLGGQCVPAGVPAGADAAQTGACDAGAGATPAERALACGQDAPRLTDRRLAICWSHWWRRLQGVPADCGGEGG